MQMKDHAIKYAREYPDNNWTIEYLDTGGLLQKEKGIKGKDLIWYAENTKDIISLVTD